MCFAFLSPGFQSHNFPTNWPTIWFNKGQIKPWMVLFGNPEALHKCDGAPYAPMHDPHVSTTFLFIY